MNAPEHYQEAERLIGEAQAETGAPGNAEKLTEALVHAVLAASGASALVTSTGALADKDRKLWHMVAGVIPKAD